MSKPGYVIVEGRDLKHLAGYVNDAIQNGYSPTGGPFLIYRGGFGEDDRWGQAMVLREGGL